MGAAAKLRSSACLEACGGSFALRLGGCFAVRGLRRGLEVASRFGATSWFEGHIAVWGLYCGRGLHRGSGASLRLKGRAARGSQLRCDWGNGLAAWKLRYGSEVPA